MLIKTELSVTWQDALHFAVQQTLIHKVHIQTSMRLIFEGGVMLIKTELSVAWQDALHC